MTTYEIRDHPDDLPILCTTLSEAERSGAADAAPPALASRFLSMKCTRNEGSDL